MKKALILGVTGQDGSYLAEILLEKGYEVHGLYRRVSTGNLNNLSACINHKSFYLHKGDVLDWQPIDRLIETLEPDEIYNEADQDNVDDSFKMPDHSTQITYGVVTKLLESVRWHGNRSRIFQPCSAMMFGGTPPPQNEDSKFDPQSPYACAKTAAYYLCRHYRQSYGIFVSTGILYNHHSKRRHGTDYLLSAVADKVRRLYEDLPIKLFTCDANNPMDIGDPREYMEAAWSMLQLDKPDDYVIGTGNGVTLCELLGCAKDYYLGLMRSHRDLYVLTTDTYKYPERPGPKHRLIADSSKAHKDFGFSPQKTYTDIIPTLFD